MVRDAFSLSFPLFQRPLPSPYSNGNGLRPRIPESAWDGFENNKGTHVKEKLSAARGADGVGPVTHALRSIFRQNSR
jgi:hypothetical protein